MAAYLLLTTVFFFLWVATATAAATPGKVLMVVVNKSNPVESISPAELRSLFLGAVAQWSNKQPVTLVEREPSSPAFQTTLLLILRMKEREYQRWLLQLEFRGVAIPLIKILNSDEGAAKYVFNVPGAIAVTDGAPNGAIWSDIKILRVDGKRPDDSGYPLK